MKTPPAFSLRGVHLYLLIALFLAVAGVLGYTAIRKYVSLDNFGCVEEGRIYRCGRLYPAQLEKVIRKYGIRTILHANDMELSLRDTSRFRETCLRHNVRMIPMMLEGDGRGIFEQYDAAVSILRESTNLPALVCCARGTHRTGAIIAAHRVLTEGWSVSEAFREMENYRFRPHPHRYNGAEHLLLPYLREYFASRSSQAICQPHQQESPSDQNSDRATSEPPSETNRE